MNDFRANSTVYDNLYFVFRMILEMYFKVQFSVFCKISVTAPYPVVY